MRWILKNKVAIILDFRSSCRSVMSVIRQEAVIKRRFCNFM